MDRLPRVGRAIVVAFGVLLAVGVATAGDHPGAVDDPDPAASLVQHWIRSRTATYVARGTFTRTTADGRSIRAAVVVAQRAPDRLLVEFGEIRGRRDDRELLCPAALPADIGSDPIGSDRCHLGPPGPDFVSVVADETAAFRALVSGPDPLYAVTGLGARAGRDCWRMTRTRFDPRSGYGIGATVCFDATSGAVRSVVVDHGDVRDETVYDDIALDVTDADLEP